MERMTAMRNGVAVYVGPGCKYDTGMISAELSSEHIRQVLTRLSAYEDTELDPEKIKNLISRALLGELESPEMEEYNGSALERADRLIAEYEFLGPIDHLRELAQAEKDGRLVVLPCKVGDLLYEVDLPKYGVITCKVLHVGTYNGPVAHVEGNPMVSAVSVGVEVVEGHGKGSGYAFEAEDFGKTVFLTREEAEAALKKKGANNEAD